MESSFAVIARKCVSNGDWTAMRFVFDTYWKIKTLPSNSVSSWRNTMASSVQILFLLPRNECKFKSWICFRSLTRKRALIWRPNAGNCLDSIHDLLCAGKLACSIHQFCNEFDSVFFFVRYCNSHLQVLGIVPKKNRKKKPSESLESNANFLPNSADTNFKLDGVVMTHHKTSMVFVPPVVVPFHRKKAKLHSEKEEVSIPAVHELKERHKQFQRDRHNLFSSYGKFNSVLFQGACRWTKLKSF